MDAPPIIRNAEPADLDILVDTLSNSFARDPMLNWVFPKTQLYPFFFHMLVKDVYLPRGIVRHRRIVAVRREGCRRPLRPVGAVPCERVAGGP